MIRYIFLVLFFVTSKSYSLEIQCKFEEVYANGNAQNGFFLIKDQNLMTIGFTFMIRTLMRDEYKIILRGQLIWLLKTKVV